MSQPTFHPYAGPLTGAWARALVIPRYAYAELLRSKLTLAMLVGGCVVPAVALATVYARHNATVLAVFGGDIARELQLDSDFFVGYLFLQACVAFFLALWIGPPLIARDVRDNALPLYLARPLSRAAYVGGKLLVLLGPLSLVTWGFGLVILGAQTAFDGVAWLREHAGEALALVVGSWALILPLALGVLAVSAVLRRTWAARGVIFGGVIVLRGVAAVINELFGTGWGEIVAPTSVAYAIWADLMGHAAWFGVIDARPGIPAWAAWSAVALWTGLSVVVLARKVRAYEAVR